MTTAGTLQRAPLATGRLRDAVVEHSLLAYFVLAFGITWTYEVLVFALLDLPDMPWLIFGAFGPAVAAILVTRAAEGTTGVRSLLLGIRLWRVDVRWYAFALVGLPILGILSFVFLPHGTENLPDSALLVAPTYLLLVVVMASLGGGQEEPGWRGFALPRMQAAFGPLTGTLLLGAAWGLWHLPLYVWVSDYNNAGSGFVTIAASFLGFCGYSLALSLIMTWVFNGTRGSLLLVMLVHGSMNSIFGLAPETRLASWIVTLAIAVLALFVVAGTRGRLGYGGMALALRKSSADKC